MNIINVKKAEVSDGKIISEIIRESFKQQAQLLRISDVEHPNYVAFETEKMTKKRINETEVKILFANGSPIGTIGSYLIGETGNIERLAIIPSFRGNDYGKLLLEQTETELFNRGCSIINISIVARFQRLKEYYEEFGYKPYKTATLSLPLERTKRGN